MVDLVPFDGCCVPLFSVLGVLIVEMLVPIPELLDDELLQLNDVNDIKHGFDVVENHDAELAGDAAVREVPDYQ